MAARYNTTQRSGGKCHMRNGGISLQPHQWNSIADAMIKIGKTKKISKADKFLAPIHVIAAASSHKQMGFTGTGTHEAHVQVEYGVVAFPQKLNVYRTRFEDKDIPQYAGTLTQLIGHFKCNQFQLKNDSLHGNLLSDGLHAYRDWVYAEEHAPRAVGAEAPGKWPTEKQFRDKLLNAMSLCHCAISYNPYFPDRVRAYQFVHSFVNEYGNLSLKEQKDLLMARGISLWMNKRLQYYKVHFKDVNGDGTLVLEATNNHAATVLIFFFHFLRLFDIGKKGMTKQKKASFQLEFNTEWEHLSADADTLTPMKQWLNANLTDDDIVQQYYWLEKCHLDDELRQSCRGAGNSTDLATAIAAAEEALKAAEDAGAAVETANGVAQKMAAETKKLSLDEKALELLKVAKAAAEEANELESTDRFTGLIKDKEEEIAAFKALQALGKAIAEAESALEGADNARRTVEEAKARNNQEEVRSAVEKKLSLDEKALELLKVAKAAAEEANELDSTDHYTGLIKDKEEEIAAFKALQALGKAIAEAESALVVANDAGRTVEEAKARNNQEEVRSAEEKKLSLDEKALELLKVAKAAAEEANELESIERFTGLIKDKEEEIKNAAEEAAAKEHEEAEALDKITAGDKVVKEWLETWMHKKSFSRHLVVRAKQMKEAEAWLGHKLNENGWKFKRTPCADEGHRKAYEKYSKDRKLSRQPTTKLNNIVKKLVSAQPHILLTDRWEKNCSDWASNDLDPRQKQLLSSDTLEVGPLLIQGAMTSTGVAANQFLAASDYYDAYKNGLPENPTDFPDQAWCGKMFAIYCRVRKIVEEVNFSGLFETPSFHNNPSLIAGVENRRGLVTEEAFLVGQRLGFFRTGWEGQNDQCLTFLGLCLPAPLVLTFHVYMESFFELCIDTEGCQWIRKSLCEGSVNALSKLEDGGTHRGRHVKAGLSALLRREGPTQMIYEAMRLLHDEYGDVMLLKDPGIKRHHVPNLSSATEAKSLDQIEEESKGVIQSMSKTYFNFRHQHPLNAEGNWSFDADKWLEAKEMGGLGYFHPKDSKVDKAEAEKIDKDWNQKLSAMFDDPQHIETHNKILEVIKDKGRPEAELNEAPVNNPRIRSPPPSPDSEGRSPKRTRHDSLPLVTPGNN